MIQFRSLFPFSVTTKLQPVIVLQSPWHWSLLLPGNVCRLEYFTRSPFCNLMNWLWLMLHTIEASWTDNKIKTFFFNRNISYIYVYRTMENIVFFKNKLLQEQGTSEKKRNSCNCFSGFVAEWWNLVPAGWWKDGYGIWINEYDF